MGSHTPRGVPAQATSNEIKESIVVALQGLAELLGARASAATLRRDRQSGLAQRIEEQLLPSALLDKVFLRRPKHLHDTGKLLLFILSGENRIPSEEFGQDTAHTPHVDGHTVRHAKNDFRGAIEPTLNVRVHLLVLEAARAKVNHPDL